MATTHEQAPLDVLVVDDEPDVAAAIDDVLRERGHHASVEHDGDRAMRRIGDHVYDLVICDVRLPGADGLHIFRALKQQHPATSVILMSGRGTIHEAVAAVKQDAADYLAKPFTLDELLAAVTEVEARVARERSRGTSNGNHHDVLACVVGESPAMVELRRRIRLVADADGPVLITGETGTGKELIARTIHELGKRSSAPFVAVNCAAFPDTLLEAELFGHERGAFTGAVGRRSGRFRTAEQGTLFLDEIAEMSSAAQAAVLRVLEDGSFQQLGSDVTRHADVRILSATNLDLDAALHGGGFREDLYYRLKMFHLHVVPLRERRADLPLLVDHFLSRLMPGASPRLTPRAWAALTHHAYPGNVRELRHALAHAVAIAGGPLLDVHHLPDEIAGAPMGDRLIGDRVQTLSEAEREFERDYLLRTLGTTGWNKTRAARALGISRKTLWKKLRQLEID